MASMSYCRWQNIRDDMRDAVNAWDNGATLNRDEKSAMKDVCEMFVDLLQQSGISEEGYKEVDLALMELYGEIDERNDEDD